MKKGLLALAIAGLALTMSSCGNEPAPTPVDPGEEYVVTIDNKEALQETWYDDGATRTVEISTDPAVIIGDAFYDGDLVVTSSNSSIIEVLGDDQIKPVSAGTATIKATYKHKFEDSVELTVTARPAIRVVTAPEEGHDYYLGVSHTSGKLYAQSVMATGTAKFYISGTNDRDKAALAHVHILEDATDEFRYTIGLMGVDDEGQPIEKMLGTTSNEADNGKHYNLGFVGDVVPDTEIAYVLATFRLNADFSLSTVVDGIEFFVGSQAGKTTISLGDATKVVKANLFEEGEAVPVETITVEPTEVTLRPGLAKQLNLTITPQAASAADVTWTSSDEEVATVVGGKVTAQAKNGTATITATAGGKSASAVVTVAGEPLKYGTEDDPISVAEARETLDAIGKGEKTIQKMYVKGVVSSSKEPNQYGREVWLYNDRDAKGFELYSSILDSSLSFGNEENALKGFEVVACGWGTLFNTTYELTNTDPEGNRDNPKILSAVPGVEPQPEPEPDVLTGKTCAEFLADERGNGKIAYELTGKVTKWAANKADGTQYGNFYLSDDNGETEVYVYGATADATKLAWNANGAIYEFTNPKDFLTNELTKTITLGSIVTMKITRCDYTNSSGETTLEGNGVVTAVDNSEVVPVVIPEPDVLEGKSCAEFLADTQGNGKQAYILTGTVTNWVSGKTDGTQYGNFYLSDDNGETEVYVYGSTATATALEWNETSGVYAFTNPKDFLTNELTKTIQIGSVVTVKLTRCDYTNSKTGEITLEGNGIVTAVDNSGLTPATIPEPDVLEGKSCAEFLADTQGNGKQAYILTGTVTKWASGKADGTQYGNFYMSDDEGTTEVYVYGATATATALEWNETSGIYAFTNPKDFLTNELTKTIQIGSVVTVKLTRCDYTNSKTGEITLEGNGIVTAVDNSGLTPATIPEPALITGKSCAEFLADTQGNFKQLYELTGTVTRWRDDKNDATQYGSYYISDDEGTTEVYVYGSTANASALVWNETTGAYSYASQRDFLTNETTKDLAIGSVVTIKVTRCDYTDKEGVITLEADGIIVSIDNSGVTPVEPPEVPEGTITEYTKGANSYDATVNGTAGIKVGTSKNAGEVSFKVPAGTTKVTLHLVAWKGAAGTVAVAISNGTLDVAELSALANDGISGSSNDFTLTGEDVLEEDFVFVLTLSDVTEEATITLTSGSAKRFVVWGASYE